MCNSTCNMMNWISVGAYAVAIPVYVVLCSTIVKYPRTDKRLRHPYFLLLLSTSIADIVNGCSAWLFARLRLWGLAFDTYAMLDPFFIHFGNSFCHQMTNTLNIGITLMAVNRFTAVVMPTRHEMVDKL